MEKPIKRSELRLKLGMFYYGTLRKIFWLKNRKSFAKTFSEKSLPFQYFSHKTILLRKLKDVDMWMQENKIINLKIACTKLNGILLKPGEVFSYWKLIGNPSKSKGYVEGMVLKNGGFHAGIGGGLCQLSNLIFWMTIHTPLTVVERHRHGYDVFPDANRTQPFGSGATCFYPHGDLMIKNDTSQTYQLYVTVGDKFLHGEWRVSEKPRYKYEIVEKNHKMETAYWGGFIRSNEIYSEMYDENNVFQEENLVAKNTALMMYSPFLESAE